MRKILLALVCALGLWSMPVQAGQIEIEGVWYAFEDLLVEGGPILKGQTQTGLSSYKGMPDPLLKKPARILAFMGSPYGIYRNRDLLERFWPLSNVSITLKDTDGKLNLELKHVLVPRYKVKGGWYELKLSLWKEREKILAVFNTLADAASEDNEDFRHQRCVEFRGRVTAWGQYNRYDPSESKWYYEFNIDSARIAAKIPKGFLSDAPPVPTLEEATELCSSP